MTPQEDASTPNDCSIGMTPEEVALNARDSLPVYPEVQTVTDARTYAPEEPDARPGAISPARLLLGGRPAS